MSKRSEEGGNKLPIWLIINICKEDENRRYNKYVLYLLEKIVDTIDVDKLNIKTRLYTIYIIQHT